MPAKTRINFAKADEPKRFPTPSKACQRQRGLYEETGLVLNAKNNGVFTKTGWSACKIAPSAAGKSGA